MTLMITNTSKILMRNTLDIKYLQKKNLGLNDEHQIWSSIYPW